MLQQCTGLTHLDVSGSDPEDWLPAQRQQAALGLTAALQGMHRLLRLHVRELQCEGSEAALASALQPLTQLQHLHVQHSCLGDAGVAALVPALSAMPWLQTLQVLWGMTCLQTLHLINTSIGDGEMVVLAPALAALPHLHTLGVVTISWKRAQCQR